MNKAIIPAWWICWLGLGFAMPVAAANIGMYSFLRNTPAELFADEDWRLFKDALNGSLNGAAEGATQTWKNPATRVSGEITILKSSMSGGQDCRQARITNRAKDRKRTSVAVFCKQPDGSWKVRTGQ